ncbi:RNA/RNP complex-1-interacting phosphatase isoform X2 [Catharus ustulatus]|uniref:RNA/RNP complex-1-interacting phosphatase isoform X2 n=1 Tax=Catharus ustulatus TaxID=91951 RepID=UPI00140E5EA2|nr:RNA/RNP complex-1-interacting phosphatase isoform X2 [Catharus ustulatus]
MAGGGSCRVPERWTDYIPLGHRMPGTRFIAFKVPLKESFDQNLLPEDRFSPHDLIREVEERKEELGLIIDLTCTTRYYGREELPPTLRYVKILTMGHKIPNRKTISRFKHFVKRFLTANKDNDKLIGVHCTHGLNRTGYLVCRYLIDVEGMEPNAAIELFNKCRGHPIERMNYIQDLQKRALKNCKEKNSGSDVLRNKGSTPAKPQKQLVKHPQHCPSQPSLAEPRNPGSSKKKQWPGPTAQEQPQELGHGHRALEQRQLKKLDHLEQNHLQQRQQKKQGQQKWNHLEQKKQMKQNYLEQNHPEQRQQKWNHLEQNQLEQKKQMKQNHQKQNHLEQRKQTHLEQRKQKKWNHLEQNHLEQNHLEQRKQKKSNHLEQNHLEQRKQNHLEQNHLEQRKQNHLEQRKQNHLEQNHLEQRKQKRWNHLEQNHLEQRKQKKGNHLEQNHLEQRKQKKWNPLEQNHLEENNLEQRKQRKQNHLEQRQQKRNHIEQNHLEQRQPCSLAPRNSWSSPPSKKKHKELLPPQSPQPSLPQEPSPARKRQRSKHRLGEQEMS